MVNILIATKRTITSYCKTLNVKKPTTYEVESSGYDLGPPNTCGGVKPVDQIPNPSPLDNGIYNSNTYINKR
jgi:hypothetical protein